MTDNRECKRCGEEFNPSAAAQWCSGTIHANITNDCEFALCNACMEGFGAYLDQQLAGLTTKDDRI